MRMVSVRGSRTGTRADSENCQQQGCQYGQRFRQPSQDTYFPEGESQLGQKNKKAPRLRQPLQAVGGRIHAAMCARRTPFSSSGCRQRRPDASNRGSMIAALRWALAMLLAMLKFRGLAMGRCQAREEAESLFEQVSGIPGPSSYMAMFTWRGFAASTTSCAVAAVSRASIRCRHLCPAHAPALQTNVILCSSRS
jgi:hypothetical protein